MHISVVATDLDGTLWDTDLAVHVETMSVIEQLDRRRIPVLVATGRRAQSALFGLRRSGLDSRPGVLMNGALARDDLRAESFLAECIAPATAALVHEAFLDAGLEPLVYIDHPEVDLLHGDAPAAGDDYIRSAPGIRHAGDLASAVRSEPVIGFGAFGFARDLLDPLARHINDEGLATAVVGQSLLEGDHGLMIQGPGITKQTAIEAWCRRHDVDVGRVVAVGDGANDLEMLDAAHVAIVPSSASAEALALADHIVPPNEDGGWKDVAAILGF